MSRTSLALLVGFVGLLLYLGLVLWIGDWVQQRHWAVQAAYYVLAGLVWVFPVRALIIWTVAARR